MFRSWTEVRADYLQSNLQELRSGLPPECGIMSVLKANAYGHGAINVATALKAGSQAFAVACLSEAQVLRQNIPDRDILLLAPALPTERRQIAKWRLIPTVSSIEEAAEYGKLSGSQPIRISIKIDTGMGRIGIWQDDAQRSLKAISQLPGILVHSIATHLPAGNQDPIFSERQLQWMEDHRPMFRKIFPGVLLHALNSAGILEFPHYAFDLVRPGLALYGIASPRKHQHRLKPVLSWKTRVTEIRNVGKNRSVSYGRTYITPKPCRLATLAVGYADGYPLQLSGTPASVLIHGCRCPVVGCITMDQTIVDVSALSRIARGDVATLIGEEGEKNITVSDVADWAGTIPWEILTRIHQRVACVFL